jgi:cobalt-zinc-cadmium efflux system membrane fusion protein
MHPRLRAAIAQAVGQVPTLVVLAALGGIGWWGYTHDWKLGGRAEEKSEKKQEPDTPSGEPSDPDQLPPVRLASEEAAAQAGIVPVAARQRLVSEVVTANGMVDFDQNRIAHLSSRARGTVWSVEKGAGDVVRKGEVLALVSAADVGKAKGEFLNSLVVFHIKEKQLERTQAAANSIPERQLREAEAQLREARIHLFSDQQALLNLGLELRLDDVLSMKDEEAVNHLRLLGLPESVRKRVDPATLTNNLLPMTAPFDSTVIRRDLVVGEQVSTTEMHFTVADLRQLWILLYVRLDDVGRLTRDQEVTFRPDGVAEEVPSGHIAWVGAEVDEKTHTVLARVEIPNPGGRLRPHTFGRGKVVVGQHSGVVVPDEAVQWDGRSHLVFVEESASVYRPRRVEVGIRADGYTEVRGIRKGDAVRDGERVAGPGSHVLKSEMLKDRIAGGD